jgi:hypothetical protein
MKKSCHRIDRRNAELAELAMRLAGKVKTTTKQLNNDRFVHNFTAIFEPLRYRIDEYCDSLERRHQSLSGSVLRKCKDLRKRLKSIDRAVIKRDFEKARRKRGGLRFSMNELAKCLEITAEELRGVEDKQGGIRYTRGVGQNIWMKVLKLSRSTVRRHIANRDEDRPYHFKEISKRKWALPIDEVPAEVFEQYKIDLNPSTNKNA